MKNFKKSKMGYLLILISLFFLTSALYGQDYTEKITIENIKFEFKWRKEKILVNDSPDALFLKITSTSNQQKLIGFEINYYWKGLRSFGSDYHEYCLKPGQTIRGKKWNLAFPVKMNDEKNSKDEKFTWEIEKLNIEENTTCESGLELKLVPKHNSTPSRENHN